MANKHLNKRTRFKCQNGNGVFFAPQSGDNKTTISGDSVLLDDCILKLVGPPRPGQCNLYIDPNTKAPAVCGSPCVTGNWDNNTNVKVVGKGALNSGCSIKCSSVAPYPTKGTIKPFAPTYMSFLVDDGASGKSVNFDSIDSQEDAGSTKESSETSDIESDNKVESQNSENSSVTNEEDEKKENEVKYALCDYKNCEKAETCKYLKASYQLKETNESKNANELKNNIGRDMFDLYAEDCGAIATTLYKFNTYSVAHHHIIPANQCFKQFPEIVKLANFFDYDINNARNAICLPTMTQGFEKEEKIKISFNAMEKLGKQWHMGGHSYTSFLRKIDGIGKEIEEKMRNERPIKDDYKNSVNEMLQQFLSKLEADKHCVCDNYEDEAIKFAESMNHICGKVANRLRKFETVPKKSNPFFVSALSVYFAYYDILYEYEDKLF